jgi:hypothetical protein
MKSDPVMKFRVFRARLAIPASLGAALLLSSCSSTIQVCPVAVILADAASKTVFHPGTAPDLANVLYTVTLIDAKSECTYDKHTLNTDSSLTLTFRATRSPSAASAQYSALYFVAVNQNAKLISKRAYTLNVRFAPGASSAIITATPDDTLIHIENGHLPWDYQLLSGMQLSDADIAFNKKMGRYVP